MTHPAPRPTEPQPIVVDHSQLRLALQRLGPPLFGAGLVGLGVQCLITALPVPGLEPLPAWLLGTRWWAYLSGVALVVGGSLAIGERSRVSKRAVTWLGALLWTWVLLLQLPPLLANPRNGGIWTTAFEAAALGGAAWVLTRDPVLARTSDWSGLARVGRAAFGVALLVFGGLHLVYHDVVAGLVPAWIPAHLFWAYATGLAHIAAGLSILSGVLARLGAAWVGAMFGSWVLIVHAPRVLNTPTSRPEWASLLIALAMCGGSWLIGARIAAPAERAPDGHIHLRPPRARARQGAA